MSYPAHVQAEAERLGVTPGDLRAFRRGLKPLRSATLFCPECDKEYKTEGGLRNHVNTTHSEEGGDDA